MGEQQTVSLGSRHSKKWLKWLIFLALLVVLLEFSLRFTLGLGNPVLQQRDSATGYVVAPSQNVRRFFCRNYINRFSMRSPEISPTKPPGVLRVLIIGDSVVYGTTYLDQDSIFTSILDRELGPLLHRKVQVLNASAGGWAVGNETAYLRSRGTFDSDLVIFFLNTGDLTQPFNGADYRAGMSPRDPKPWTALGELWSRYIRPRLFHQQTVDAGSQATQDTVENVVTRETPAVLASLDEARQFSLSQNARFAIVYSPAHGADWDTPPLAAGLKMLKTWAQDHNVPLVDLDTAYSQAPQSEIYLSGGIHLKAKGHQIAAHEIEKQWEVLMPSSSTAPTTAP